MIKSWIEFSACQLANTYMCLFWYPESLEVTMAMLFTDAVEIVWRTFKHPTNHYSCLSKALPQPRAICPLQKKSCCVVAGGHLCVTMQKPNCSRKDSLLVAISSLPTMS